MTNTTTSSDDEFNELVELYKDKLPKHWDILNRGQKLEWIAHRMLLDEREKVRQSEGSQAARDFFMSDYQIERRRRREVYSKLDGGWDSTPPTAGNFYTIYVDPNELRTGRNQEESDGQKNP